MSKDGGSQMLRWFDLLRLLQRDECSKREELAEAVGLSVRQIERILARLQEMGFPVINERGKGYRLLKGSNHLPVRLTLEESWALLLLQSCSLKGLGSGADSALQQLLQRLRAQMTEEACQRIGSMQPWVGSDPPTEEVTPEVWQNVVEALSRGLQIRFEYHKVGEAESTRRQVEPWGLTTVDRRWYLQAFETSTQSFKNFRLIRMRQVALLDLKARRPSDYVAGDHLFHRLQIGKGPLVEVRLHCSPFLVEWLRENPLHPQQHIEGNRVCLQVRKSEILTDVLLGLNGLEGAEPAWLQEALLQRLDERRTRLSEFSPES